MFNKIKLYNFSVNESKFTYKVRKDLDKLGNDEINDLIELHYQSELADIKFTKEFDLDRDPIKLSVKEVKSKIKHDLSQGAVYFLCYDKNKIVGLIKYFPEYGMYDASFIQEVIVHSDYRGKGISNNLMDKLIKYNKDKRIILGANASNSVALNLYKKYGFKVWAYRMVR